jgi:hypothetical protein
MGNVLKELIAICFLLSGCATTSSSGTFTQALAAAEAADDAVVVTSTTLLQAGSITSTQAKKILTITDGVSAALTLANNAYTAGNLSSANAQIAAAIAALTTIQTCLTAASNKQPIDTCLAPITSP